jgi:uncharacterized protein (TIGR03067 family)
MMNAVSLALVAFLAVAPVAWSDAPKDAGPLDGTWQLTAGEVGGMKFPDEVAKSIKLMVKDGQYTVTTATVPDKGTCKLDAKANPKTIDITGTEGPNKGKTFLAIYELNGDTLRVCYDLSGEKRPTEFATKPGTKLFLATYQRQK